MHGPAAKCYSEAIDLYRPMVACDPSLPFTPSPDSSTTLAFALCSFYSLRADAFMETQEPGKALSDYDGIIELTSSRPAIPKLQQQLHDARVNRQVRPEVTLLLVHVVGRLICIANLI